MENEVIKNEEVVDNAEDIFTDIVEVERRPAVGRAVLIGGIVVVGAVLAYRFLIRPRIEKVRAVRANASESEESEYYDEEE